jgi:hypothetical protein
MVLELQVKDCLLLKYIPIQIYDEIAWQMNLHLVLNSNLLAGFTSLDIEHRLE